MAADSVDLASFSGVVMEGRRAINAAVINTSTDRPIIQYSCVTRSRSDGRAKNDKTLTTCQSVMQ